MSSKENADYLMQQAQAAGIADPKELANFMGQMQVESGGYKSMEENLHYSGERLLQVFPGRNGLTDLKSADEVAKHGPEGIANAIYGGEWGDKHLGNKEEGDGWKYRGRGYIQLTGHDRYAEAGTALGLDLVNKPELAADRQNAANIAIWYWKSQVVTQGDQKSVDDATYDINAAGKGLAERRTAAAAWEHKLEHGYVPGAPEPTSSRTLKQGMSGDDVRQAQDELHNLGYLHGNPNSHFDPATKAAVEDFQRTQGLGVDGKIGSITQQHLDAALRDKQISDVTTNLPQLREFSDPSHPQNALYSTLRDGFPPGTSPELLSQATATCYMSGIRQPEDLGNVVYGNGRILFDTSSLFARPAQMDVNQAPPNVQQTMQQVQQFDQQQAQIQAQVQQANQQTNQQQGPMMGGPQMGGH
jgi:putative chitinase